MTKLTVDWFTNSVSNCVNVELVHIQGRKQENAVEITLLNAFFHHHIFRAYVKIVYLWFS